MSVARTVMGATFIFTGLLHFKKPRMYEAIMPAYLPAHRELVYASGVAEIAGGVGLMLPQQQWRTVAGWWLIATLVAVFPANVNMAVDAERFKKVPEPVLWARLPLQAGIIYWIWHVAVRR